MASSAVAITTDASLMDMIMDVSTELIWFCLGVVVFRCLTHWLHIRRAARPQPKKHRRTDSAKPSDSSPAQQVAEWKRVKAAGLPLGLAEAKTIGKALAGFFPDHLDDFISFLSERSPSTPVDASMVNTWLSALASTGQVEKMHALADMAACRLAVGLDSRSDELLLGAAAALGMDHKVQKLIEKITCSQAALTGGACVQLAWGYLHARNIAEASRWTHRYHKAGSTVPPNLLWQLVGLAISMGPCAVDLALDGLQDEVPLTVDTTDALLRHCLAREDPETAHRVERLASVTGVAFSSSSIEALLKLYAKSKDPRALGLLQGALATGFVATQGFCGNVLSRCAESQFLEFAEAIGGHIRVQGSPTLATCKTLMKAYVSCGAYERACDLYVHAERNGPEPDDVMRGCAMKFAVLCGNMPLCFAILDKVGLGEPQLLCAVIRAASRDGNVDRVSMVFQKLEEKAGGTALDTSIVNAAMEACVAGGGGELAARIFERARSSGQADSKTYNFMIKDRCARGCIADAAILLDEMEAAGHTPENVSSNSLLGAAVAAGDMRRAWQLFRRLEARAAVDEYALSIMMKAAKTLRAAAAEPVLALLDRPGVDPCSDRILLNSSLDACILHRDTDRLSALVDAYDKSDIPASVQTYGLLIKASCCIGRTQRCKELWRQMTAKRGLQPNSMTLGCMVDALVTGRKVDDAVQLVKDWKEAVGVNIVIYATLMKGFVHADDADGAMGVYREIKHDGLQMNLVSYTTLIDSQARIGNMEAAADLFEQMTKDGCEPNTITFSTMIKGHCLNGDMLSALKLFHDMTARGLKADAVVFNTLLDGCLRHANFELADTLLADMATMSVAPTNFTLCVITKMWGRRRQLAKAFEAVRTLSREHGVKPDARNAVSLINACFVNQSPSQAIQAFEETRSWKHFRGFSGPEDSMYGALILGLVRHGRLQVAASYADEACSGSSLRISTTAGPASASVSALKLLFRELATEGLLAELGRPVIKKLEAAGERSFAIALQQSASNSHPSSRRSAWDRP